MLPLVKKPRDYIDAEFTVVGQGKPPEWNGLGKPPSWDGWNWPQRIAYLVIYVTLLGGAVLLAHTLSPMIPLPDHW
jgi:hypothetical protein